MIEYIERDAAIKVGIEYWTEQMENLPKYTVDGYECYPPREANVILGHNKDLMGRIKAIPKADVVPVKHGEWLWELADNGWADHICSLCGWTENTDIHVSIGYKYCPCCGAKMEADGEGK